MKRIMTNLIAATLFFFAMMTQSCVRLDLKTADDTSDEAEIGFDIAWDKISGTALPDSVYIAMNKVSDILKYSYETDSKGAFLPYTIEKDDTVVAHREYAEYGHYVMLAYHCDKDNYTLSGAQRFMKDKTISVRDFKATVKDLPEEELTAMRGVRKLTSIRLTVSYVRQDQYGQLHARTIFPTRGKTPSASSWSRCSRNSHLQ